MANFVLLFLCLGLGMFFKKKGLLPANAPKVLNHFVIFVSFPALTLLSIHRIPLDLEVLFPAGMAWLLFLFSLAVLIPLARLFGWDKKTLGALILTAGLGNTAFMGFPLLEAFFGPSSLSVGVLADQAGSFVVLSTLGLFTAAACASKSLTPKKVFLRIASFPAASAFVLALLTKSIEYPPVMVQVLERLSITMVPLALVSVGFQLNFRPELLRHHWGRLTAGLGYKLIIGPALIAAIFIGGFGAHGEAIQVTLMQAAMPPMVMGAVLASDNDLCPDLANLMVGAGIPACFVTLSMWHWLLRAV